MNFFKSTALSPTQIERRERIRMKGRSHFIMVSGILGFGLPMFLFMTIVRFYDYGRGWRFPTGEELYFKMILRLLIWTILGYWFGAWMWQTYFEEPSKGV
jgi:hypothetical protein